MEISVPSKKTNLTTQKEISIVGQVTKVAWEEVFILERTAFGGTYIWTGEMIMNKMLYISIFSTAYRFFNFFWYLYLIEKINVWFMLNISQYE